jgi:tetratricopeptide (TPR) repeat protein
MMSSLPRSFALSLLLLVSLTASAQYNIKKLMEEGRSTLDAGYYVASMQIFDRVVSLKPRLYEAWYLMALSKYHLEDLEGAEQDCNEALKLNPYVPEIFDLRGMVRIKTEHYDSAAVDYTRALELQPDNRDYWYNRAFCYYRAGQRTLALQQLDYITDRWRDFKRAQQLQREVVTSQK